MAFLGRLAKSFSRKGAFKVKRTLLFLQLFTLAIPSVHVSASFKPVEIKAAYLYNLVNFVYWPGSNDVQEPFVIEILGNPVLAENLELLTRGETLRGRRIIIKSIDSVSEIDDCQILFVDSSKEKEFSPELLDGLSKKHILTVGNSLEFLKKGAVVGLISSSGRIFIAVNQRLAKKAGISFSSKLLKVARIL